MQRGVPISPVSVSAVEFCIPKGGDLSKLLLKLVRSRLIGSRRWAVTRAFLNFSDLNDNKWARKVSGIGQNQLGKVSGSCVTSGETFHFTKAWQLAKLISHDSSIWSQVFWWFQLC